MVLTESHNIEKISRHFQFQGELADSHRYGSGHINDTYLLVYQRQGMQKKYILRRINHSVFTRPEILVDNTIRVCAHMAQQLQSRKLEDADRRAQHIIPTVDGKYYFKTAAGDYWCAFDFVENTKSIDYVKSPEQAFEAAKSFGFFQKCLGDLPAASFQDTIPQFHDGLSRFRALENAISADTHKRAEQVAAEIEFILSRKNIAQKLSELLNSKALPLRLIHNDTKINNVLFDKNTGEGLCVIDLDTVMPGTVLFDFGDMARTFTSPAAEDEQDLAKVYMRKEIFDALTRGYLSQVYDLLVPAETEHLVLGAQFMTLIMGVRFLTDYLMGDVYYKIYRPTQNIDRCRNQIQLLKSIESHSESMHQMISENLNNIENTINKFGEY